MNIGFVDLETSGLDADGWNQILCACISDYQKPKWAGGKLIHPPWANIREFRRENYPEPLWEDRRLAKAIITEIMKYDIIVSWNGIKFDETFLATRLREYGIHTKRWPRHKDLMYTARYRLRLSSAALENVSAVLNLYKQYGVRKTKLDRRLWRRAVRGDKRSYDYVVSHCREDIKVLPAAWEELKDLVTEIK